MNYNQLVDNIIYLDESTSLRRLTGSPYVKIRNGYIEFHNFNTDRLQKNIRKLYDEKNMFGLFERVYNKRQKEKYDNKKIPKSKLRTMYLKTDIFFALEVMIIFEDLYQRLRNRYYKYIAEDIKKYTWLGEQREITAKIDMTQLSKFNYILKDYQLEFIKEYPKLKSKYNLEGHLLSFEQGLGKTLTSVALAECLHKDKVIVICPNSLKGNWENEIKEYLKEYEHSQNFENEVYAIGQSKHNINKKKVKYLIINHESINSVYPYLRKDSDVMIIVDESHHFRNIKGKRVNDLLKLKEATECKDTLLMSGTPIKALPNEITPVLALIDPLFTESAAKKYMRMFNLEGLNAAEIIQRRFGMIMYRKKKSEVLSLPDKKFEDIKLTLMDGDKYNVINVKAEIIERFRIYMGNNQPKLDEYEAEYIRLLTKYSHSDILLNAYIKFLEDLKEGNVDSYHELEIEEFNEYSKKYIISDLHGEELKEFKKAETMYLRIKEHCMGKAIGEILPKYRAEMFIALYDEHKEKFLKMIAESEKKTVIYSSIRKVVEHISKDLLREGIDNVVIVGGTKDRVELINRFKAIDTCEVLVATSQALSTGVTLTEANQMLFFGTPWRDADFQQCSDRIHRIGQTIDTYIYTVLLSTGSVNLSSRMNNILQWSGDMANGFVDNMEILDENYNDSYGITYSTLLNEFFNKV